MDAVHSENPINPFLLKLQLSELYSNPLMDQFFSILLNSIGGKDFLILVAGESQSGKTSLLYKLINQIEQNVKPCQIKVRGSDGPASNNDYYPAFFYETETNQVIIVDDAHNLTYEELSIFFKNAWDGNKKTMQVVLFCEPKINKTISSLLKTMPKKTSVNKLYIPCFDKKQTESYVKHYLGFANFPEKFSFSEKNIKNIYEKSKGLPGKINHEAHKIFASKNLSALNTKESKFDPIVIMALTIFIILIVGGFAALKKPGFIPVTNSNVLFSKDTHKNIAEENQILLNTDLIEKTNSHEPINIAVITASVLQEQWIMEQKPEEYTIQIMAAKKKDAVDRFLKSNINTQGEIAYYTMYSNGDLWYKIISGRYKTLKKARTALNNLPEKLKNSGPWPRKFASLHKDINKFNKTNEPN